MTTGTSRGAGPIPRGTSRTAVRPRRRRQAANAGVSESAGASTARHDDPESNQTSIVSVPRRTSHSSAGSSRPLAWLERPRQGQQIVVVQFHQQSDPCCATSACTCCTISDVSKATLLLSRPSVCFSPPLWSRPVWRRIRAKALPNPLPRDAPIPAAANRGKQARAPVSGTIATSSSARSASSCRELTSANHCSVARTMTGRFERQSQRVAVQ